LFLILAAFLASPVLAQEAQTKEKVVMENQDYRAWLPELKSMTLFRDIEDKQLIALLEAMKPKITHLEPGDMFPPEFAPGTFKVFLKGYPQKELAPRRFKYDMPKFGEPGAMMGEIPSLSSFQEGLGHKELFTIKKKPLPEGCDLLDMTGEMLVAYYNEQVYPAQSIMLRNLLGILAQKVIDTRQDLFKTKYNVDIYNMQEGDKEKLTKGLMR
jgi:hypothetical protein